MVVTRAQRAQPKDIESTALMKAPRRFKRTDPVARTAPPLRTTATRRARTKNVDLPTSKPPVEKPNAPKRPTGQVETAKRTINKSVPKAADTAPPQASRKRSAPSDDAVDERPHLMPAKKKSRSDVAEASTKPAQQKQNKLPGPGKTSRAKSSTAASTSRAAETSGTKPPRLRAAATAGTKSSNARAVGLSGTGSSRTRAAATASTRPPRTRSAAAVKPAATRSTGVAIESVNATKVPVARSGPATADMVERVEASVSNLVPATTGECVPENGSGALLEPALEHRESCDNVVTIHLQDESVDTTVADAAHTPPTPTPPARAPDSPIRTPDAKRESPVHAPESAKPPVPTLASTPAHQTQTPLKPTPVPFTFVPPTLPSQSATPESPTPEQRPVESSRSPQSAESLSSDDGVKNNRIHDSKPDSLSFPESPRKAPPTSPFRPPTSASTNDSGQFEEGMTKTPVKVLAGGSSTDDAAHEKPITGSASSIHLQTPVRRHEDASVQKDACNLSAKSSLLHNRLRRTGWLDSTAKSPMKGDRQTPDESLTRSFPPRTPSRRDVGSPAVSAPCTELIVGYLNSVLPGYDTPLNPRRKPGLPLPDSSCKASTDVGADSQTPTKSGLSNVNDVELMTKLCNDQCPQGTSDTLDQRRLPPENVGHETASSSTAAPSDNVGGDLSMDTSVNQPSAGDIQKTVEPPSTPRKARNLAFPPANLQIDPPSTIPGSILRTPFKKPFGSPKKSVAWSPHTFKGPQYAHAVDSARPPAPPSPLKHELVLLEESDSSAGSVTPSQSRFCTPDAVNHRQNKENTSPISGPTTPTRPPPSASTMGTTTPYYLHSEKINQMTCPGNLEAKRPSYELEKEPERQIARRLSLSPTIQAAASRGMKVVQGLFMA